MKTDFKTPLLYRMVLVILLVFTAANARAEASNPDTGERTSHHDDNYGSGSNDTDEGSTTDSDGDGVMDDRDFCNGADESESLGRSGEASILHYYFGDTGLFHLAQEVELNLDKAITGYDYSIVLTEDEDVSDIDNADAVYPPTEEYFFYALRDAVRKGYMVDIYIFAHGHDGGFSARDYSDDDDDEDDGTSAITPADIKEYLSPEKIGCNGHYAPIRMVHSVSCFHSGLIDDWTEVAGAKVAMGARHVNFYPNQFNKFGDEWQDGESFGDAVDASNTSSSRTVMQSLIVVDAAINTWWYCTYMTPLGNNMCADVYFQANWNLPDYDNDESGQSNMNHSSDKLFSGDESITKNDTTFDWHVPSDIEITDVTMADDWTKVSTRTGSVITSGKSKSTKTQVSGVFEVTLKNVGDYDVGSFDVTGPSGSKIKTVSVDSLKKNKTTTVTFTVVVTKSSTGSLERQELTFTADQDEELNDTDRSNNAKTITLKANFTTDVGDRETTHNEDGTYTTEFYCVVRNYGYLAASSTSTLRVYYREAGFHGTGVTTTLIHERSISALTPGQVIAPSITYQYSTSRSLRHYVICEVDADNTIDEIDEGDNKVSGLIGL